MLGTKYLLGIERFHYEREERELSLFCIQRPLPRKPRKKSVEAYGRIRLVASLRAENSPKAFFDISDGADIEIDLILSGGENDSVVSDRTPMLNEEHALCPDRNTSASAVLDCGRKLAAHEKALAEQTSGEAAFSFDVDPDTIHLFFSNDLWMLLIGHYTIQIPPRQYRHGITFFTGGIRVRPPKDEPGGLPTTFAAHKRPAGYEVDPMP